MLYNYKLDNFVSIPTGDDKRIFIYDKNGNFNYSIIVDLSHWFVKNNCVVIKITNRNDIMLSFESRLVAQQALDKLDSVRKSILDTTGKLDPNQWIKFNTLNKYMMPNDITANYQLALNDVVSQQPKSSVKVIINTSTYVYCGKPTFSNPPNPDRPIGCYFTSPEDNGDVTKARVNDGDVQIGDKLYWILQWADDTNYELASDDSVDFEFLI